MTKMRVGVLRNWKDDTPHGLMSELKNWIFQPVRSRVGMLTG